MGSSNISAKSVGQEEYDFLKSLWGSGGAGGGTATGTATGTAGASTAKGSAAGVGATIGGAIATLIGSIISDSGSNFRTKDKGTKAGTATGTQEAVKEQTISQGIEQLGQLTAIEQWAQDRISAQPWDKKVVRNANPKPDSAIQGVKPIEQTSVKSQYGYRPIDMFREEAWIRQGGLPKDMPYDVVGGLDIPAPAQDVYGGIIDNKSLWKDYAGTAEEIRKQIVGELAGEMTGVQVGAQEGAIPGEQVGPQEGAIPGEQVGAQEGTRELTGEKTIAKDIATEKEKEIRPVEQQERDKGLPPIPYIPEGSNMEENVQQINYNNLQDVLRYLDEKQKEQWEREDAIRLETQAREDSAYQRAVADMRKSGVNPNLVGVNPAESGGGITQATGMDYSLYNAEVNKYIGLLQTELNNAFKEDENTKDRITDIIGGLINSVGWLIGIGISSKGKK